MFQNFVNTMLRLSETRDEVQVVSDQHGIPTSCIDLSFAIAELIEANVYEDEVGGIFHFSNSINQKPKTKNHITWANFAREIFSLT